MKLKLNDGEKKVLLFWIIAAAILITIFAVIEVKKNFFDKYNGNYTIVRDVNRYYTVNNAINKFYSYINSNDIDNALIIIDDNNINKTNFTNYFNFNNKTISYVPNLMYEKDIKKGVKSYYVGGYNESLNTGEYISDAYYEVILDGNNFTFSIKKIDKELYEGVNYEK